MDADIQAEFDKLHAENLEMKDMLEEILDELGYDPDFDADDDDETPAPADSIYKSNTDYVPKPTDK